jgi:hypothetical protein
MKVLALSLAAAVALSSGVPAEKKPKISVKANPSMGMSPVRVVVTAEVSGGPNDNEEFYCPSVEWDWGDDTRSSDSADCDPYVAGKSEIKRRFTSDHVYRSAGEYQIQFRLKKKDRTIGSGSAPVKIRPGLGDPGGGSGR